MSRGINKVILLGNVGRDPEIKLTQSGKQVACFSLATSRPVKRDDQWEDKTEWHRIVCWDTLAERCQKYLAKGMQVYLEGELRTTQWEDNDGVKRSMTEIYANHLLMLGSKRPQATPETTDDEVPF